MEKNSVPTNTEQPTREEMLTSANIRAAPDKADYCTSEISTLAAN
ncbi:MAG: hypothetical protein OJF51_000132 [Nitrospira sp.]|nr:MAG: hypothetical protein OJF51_000132 [Nitrospira sp.]